MQDFAGRRFTGGGIIVLFGRDNYRWGAINRARI